MSNYQCRPSDIECDGRCVIQTRDPPGQRSIYISPGDPERETYRLSTFKNYPSNVPIDACRFAANGFYFSGYRDRVKCFSCGQVIENWIVGDDPDLPGWHKADCGFKNGTDTSNVAIQSVFHQFGFGRNSPSTSSRSNCRETAARPRQLSGGQVVISGLNPPNQAVFQTASGSNIPPPSVVASLRAVENIPTNTSTSQPPFEAAPISHESNNDAFPCLYAVSPHMRSEEARLQTFLDSSTAWPTHRTNATPQEIAKAGMFYLGERDRVKCWYCNGGLQNWEPDDNPWEEHAKWFPLCEYVLQKKGPDFVSSIVARYPNLRRPALHNPAASRYLRRIVESGPSFLPLPQGNQEARGPVIVDPREEQRSRKRKIDEIMSSSEFVSNAQTMGFGERDIRAAIKRQIELNDRNFSTFESLVDSILSHEGSVSNNDEEEEEASSASENDPFISISNMSATAGAQEIKRLEESRRCKICREESASVVLIPCGHLACCVNCGRNVESCPICHSVVRERVRSYVA